MTTAKNPCLRWALRALTLILIVGAATGRAAAAPAEFHWTFTPYAWATDVGVDVELDGRQAVDETIPVSDLMEILDTIVQLRLEGQYGAHGVALDLFDVTMSDEARGLALPQGAGTADLDAEIGMTIADLAAFYDPQGDGRGLVILAGARLISERATVDARFDLAAGPDADERYETDELLVDMLIGLRYSLRLSRHWSTQMQVDASAGQTDLTWSTNPSLAYGFGDSGRFALLAGYRFMQIDFADEDGLDPEMSLSGVLVGLRTRF